MVRAILAGQKTQTRRVVKPSPSLDPLSHDYAVRAIVGRADDLPGKPFGVSFFGDRGMSNHQRCPYGVPGDRLWVRETWQASPLAIMERNRGSCVYAANLRTDPRAHGQRWRSSIFMPRWASRLTFEVASVRVERLQDITEADVWAEGVTILSFPRDAFAARWDSINGKRAPWSSNPWVWCISFRVLPSPEKAEPQAEQGESEQEGRAD